MILHPGIWSLLIGSGLVLLMLLYASAEAARVTVGWNYQSSSASQLALERKTYLISTLVQYALLFEIIATLLFVYTVDDLNPLFVGAMCATGVLNANPVGWRVLGIKILLSLLAAFWLALNRLDQQSEEYPLVRLKYPAMICLLPLVVLDFVLLISYFGGLRADIITSCCGSLFSTAGSGVGSELASLPAGRTMWVFYPASFAWGVLILVCRKTASGFSRYVLLLSSVFWLLAAIAAIVSFISLYIYEIPTHHCPFDMFQENYHYIGYPLYISMFGAFYYGMLPGLFGPLKKLSTLAPIISRNEKMWLARAFFFLVCFMIITTLPVVTGEFTLEGYF